MTTRDKSTPSSLKTRCCSRPHGSGGVGVCVVMGTPVTRCACATASEHALDAGRHGGTVRRALEDSGSYTGVGDPVADFAYEQIHHRLGATEDRPGPAEEEGHPELAAGADARRPHAVNLRRRLGD